MRALPQPPILLITDRSQSARPLPETVERIVAGGCRWISLREKDLSPAERVPLLKALLPLVRKAGGVLTVHGDAEAARLCDGLHLPAGGDIQAARAALGLEARIGLSCHSVAEIRTAAAAGADYVTLSPIFPTLSKPGYGPALGLTALMEAKSIDIPVLALGGIDAGNARSARDAGASGLAVMGGPLRAQDPARAFRDLIGAWEKTAG